MAVRANDCHPGNPRHAAAPGSLTSEEFQVARLFFSDFPFASAISGLTCITGIWFK